MKNFLKMVGTIYSPIWSYTEIKSYEFFFLYPVTKYSDWSEVLLKITEILQVNSPKWN